MGPSCSNLAARRAQGGRTRQRHEHCAQRGSGARLWRHGAVWRDSGRRIASRVVGGVGLLESAEEHERALKWKVLKVVPAVVVGNVQFGDCRRGSRGLLRSLGSAARGLGLEREGGRLWFGGWNSGGWFGSRRSGRCGRGRFGRSGRGRLGWRRRNLSGRFGWRWRGCEVAEEVAVGRLALLGDAILTARFGLGTPGGELALSLGLGGGCRLGGCSLGRRHGFDLEHVVVVPPAVTPAVVYWARLGGRGLQGRSGRRRRRGSRLRSSSFRRGRCGLRSELGRSWLAPAVVVAPAVGRRFRSQLVLGRRFGGGFRRRDVVVSPAVVPPAVVVVVVPPAR
mmetsp:Transcript_5346/g.16181  ORF Transcript_5346/g.16181 Transcript_5346/m.16181 type:complete len:338 (-) Transcript_5346:161-1174(-)